MTYSSLLHVKEGETYGLLQTIKWNGELELYNVIFELDEKVALVNFNKLQSNLSFFGFIIRDWILHFNHLYHDLLVEFFRRQSNMIAHDLARTTIYMTNVQILIWHHIVLLLIWLIIWVKFVSVKKKVWKKS